MLDIGARTLMAPMIETPGRATELIAATRYAWPDLVASPSVRTGRCWSVVADYAETTPDPLYLIA